MAESRRVQLTTLSCEAPLPTQPAPVEVKPPPGVVQEEKKCLDPPSEPSSVRLVLKLFDPDERSFPEFSYTRLLDNKINNTKVPLRRFEEEEKREIDEVAALSGELEKKYADKPKNKDRIQDLIDIGYGYDDEDSFIDNTEPYDEFVPASLTTKFGGFYINSGVLHFRHTETEDLKAREKTPESSKKRKVNDGQDKPKKKKRCREEAEETISFLDPKSSPLTELASDDKIKKKKKKKVCFTLSVTSMLKKFQREKEKERQKMDKVKPRRSAITMFPADAGGGGGLGLTDPLLSLIGSTNEHTLIQAVNAMDFDIDLDSLLDVSEAASSTKMAPPPSTETQLFSPKADNLTQSEARPQVLPPMTGTNVQLKPQLEQIQLPTHTSSTLPQCVPLPEGLPHRLEDSIRKLTVVAKTSEGESKLKFFTPEINSMLLDIELQCREQGVQLRSKVYTHLSSFLPCSRDTLLKRVKKLFLAHTEECSDVENRMQKLKEAVCRAMPEQIASFNENCQVYEQARTSKAAEEKESKQKENVGPEDNMEEKGGKRGAPKKLFKWNEEIRECLCHVLTVNMERYKRQKRSQELEEYLKTFLDNEVKLLWPKGWMQSRVLIKESREMLSLFAPLPVKRVRPEKKQPPLATSDNFSVLQESPLPHDSDDVIIFPLVLRIRWRVKQEGFQWILPPLHLLTKPRSTSDLLRLSPSWSSSQSRRWLVCSRSPRTSWQQPWLNTSVQSSTGAWGWTPEVLRSLLLRPPSPARWVSRCVESLCLSRSETLPSSLMLDTCRSSPTTTTLLYNDNSRCRFTHGGSHFLTGHMLRLSQTQELRHQNQLCKLDAHQKSIS